ncbi:MAG: hypothetical protein IRZ28_14370 [Steroidobacteraceae bacterium]|nr:hypothetical protein [Steroidobacteraceae bacterium]
MRFMTIAAALACALAAFVSVALGSEGSPQQLVAQSLDSQFVSHDPARDRQNHRIDDPRRAIAQQQHRLPD